MIQKKMADLLLLYLGALVVFQGCTTPNVPMPEQQPAIVKQYRNITVSGGQLGFRDTGIHLDKGDRYSILATGTINMCPGGSCGEWSRARPGRILRGRVVSRDGSEKHAVPVAATGYVTESHVSGILKLGYKARHKQNDRGGFSIDIIVWSKNDPEAIHAFFKAMKAQNPDNEALTDALYLASRQVAFKNLSDETTQAIEETRKELETLQKNLPAQGGAPAAEPSDAGSGVAAAAVAPPAKPQPAAGQAGLSEAKASSSGDAPAATEKTGGVADLDKMEQLQHRLALLQKQLAELDQMKQQFEAEKKRSAALAQQLAEREESEQALKERLKGGAGTPPVVVIAAPGNDVRVEVDFITISGVVEDEQGIEGIEIRINGEPLEAKSLRGTRLSPEKKYLRYDFRERVPLAKGENDIRITAVDTNGLAAHKAVRVHYNEKRRNIWAVIAGIDRYPNVRPLRYAVNDARAFYNHLVGFNQVPAENVTLLLDEEASLTRLRSALGTHLKSRAGRDDMVIIFFAGHGATEKDMMSPDGDGLEKYFLPHDADPDDLYATALPMAEVSRIFNRIRSDRLVFIVDACYSGASGGRTIGLSGIRANLSDAFFDRIASGEGRVIISASGANEVSGESSELEHGIFTYYLIEGLRGKADVDDDGMVTVDEAFRYVSHQVPRATGQEQHPVKKGTVQGQFVLSVTR